MYLGFDPGMAGAVAAIHPDGEAVVFDMPTVATVRTRREVVARELANIVAPLAVGGDAVAVLEQPIAMPSQASDRGVRRCRRRRSPDGGRVMPADMHDAPMRRAHAAETRRRRKVAGGQAELTLEEGRS